jgi:5S rRNA maturation endonuclease (ribonuclease M5)
MEKLEMESSLKKAINAEVMKIESSEVPLTSEVTCLKKIKPRAIIFKANDKDFCRLNDLIKTQFPEVEVVYVTTGPVASFLRVTKSIPFEMQNSSARPNYTIE